MQEGVYHVKYLRLPLPAMNTPNRLEAKIGIRTFYFFVTERTDEEVSILMYKQPYKLILTETGWKNHPGNGMEMSKDLVSAVIAGAGIQ